MLIQSLLETDEEVQRAAAHQAKLEALMEQLEPLMEEGKKVLVFSQFVEMLELLKVSVSKHAVLEVNLGKNLPPIRANAAQLRQIVMNLVTNASDAVGDRDGVIRSW